MEGNDEMENIFADDSDADVTSSGEEGEEEDEAMMIKPVFVPKSKRSTASTKEQQDLMQEVEEQQKRRLEEKRKELTRSQLAETLRRNEHTVHLENADNDSNFGMPSDASDYDDDVEVNVQDSLPPSHHTVIIFATVRSMETSRVKASETRH